MNKWMAVGFVLALSSCASTYTSKESGAPSPDPAGSGKSVDASAPLATSAAEIAQAKIDGEEDDESFEPTLYRGNNQQVRVPPVQEPIRFLGEDATVNFEQAPLSEVMHAIMGDILQLDYVVDQPIKGEVTLRTRTPIPRDELFAVLESLLKANNIVIIRGDDGRYLVTSMSNGTRVSPGVSNARNRGVGFSTVIIPLQYISASNMAEILEPVAEPEAFVRVDNVRNLLMLAGTRGQMNGWLEMVQTFDVDLLAGMSVGIFPLENSNAEEVHQAISALLSNGGGDKDEEGGDWSRLIRVIPIERLNSILVVTPRSHYLDIVQEWITRLDEAYQSDGDKRLYVYPAQNTSAERLAELLNSIYSGNRNQNRNASRDGDFGSSSFSAFGNDASVAPGLSRESFGTSSTSGNFQPRSDNSGLGEGNRISSVSLAGGGDSILADVRVVADPESNSLLIYSTGIQYRIIETALEQLDQEATQIIIEASIIEVTLNDDLRYGLEWTFSNEIGDDRTGTGLLTSTAARELIEPLNRGFSYSVVNSGGAIKAV
ncbi:MAG: secretin N-terminal domain-containing protein, partial [Pseudomonadota bacterium]